MNRLNLPSFAHKIQSQEGKNFIFDPLRKKYVRLTPEEWVRQHMIHYLIQHLNYPAGLMVSESTLNQKRANRQRFDIFVYNNHKQPHMLIECKATTQKLSAKTLQQVMSYNKKTIPHLLFTNGIQHFCFKLDTTRQCYSLLKKIPTFPQLN